MPNRKAATKSMHTSRIKRDKNKAEKSALKTILKKTETAIKEKNVEGANILLKNTFSVLDKAAKKNLIHKNNASRKKSELAKRLSKVS